MEASTHVTPPHEPADKIPAAPLPRSAGAPSKIEPLRILIVDDSAIVAQRLTALIESLDLGVTIDVAKDGATGMQRFFALRPHLVVLDIGLPDRSGFGVLMEMKLHRPRCPVAMLTSFAYPEFRTNALSAGADYFFVKAVDFERVADVVTGLAGNLSGDAPPPGPHGGRAVPPT